MDSTPTSAVEWLKPVLASLREPTALNQHPWAALLSRLGEKNAGERLVRLVTGVFRKMLPPGPPRNGKRLDTRWGVFGILAAQYFAPAQLGTPTPASLREAWNSFDRSILLFVYDRTEDLTAEEQARFRFAGNELEPAPNSTLSDWHRKGLEQLAEMVTLELKQVSARQKPLAKIRRAGKWLGVIFLILAALVGFKAWGFYQQARTIEQKALELEAFLKPGPKLEQIPEISTKVHSLRGDLELFQQETEPWLWLTPALGWVPQYGGDVSQAKNLLALAEDLVTAADEGLLAITPTIETTLKNDQPLEMMDLVLRLQAASPQLLNAQVALAQAQEVRRQIETERLSPRLQQILTQKIDPLFSSLAGAFPMEEALTLVSLAPRLLGSGPTGPQTYLILMQNEDELRPTGGYLTAAGSVVVRDGKLLSLNIESSELVDDLKQPFPVPPWQFKQFMNIEMFLFRDSNWFTNFPTTASWAEYFYSYSRAASADGVIALDMHVIVRLLEALGPVQVENINFPITSQNVVAYMRLAKEKRPQGVTGAWDRKQFISKLARPLLEKILQARGKNWTTLAPVLMELLDEKHILLQFDDPEAAAFLERRNWNGAVKIPAQSDFLMAVEANLGYNKSNAVMETALKYSINLSNPTQPTSQLTISQTNHSQVKIACVPFATPRQAQPDSAKLVFDESGYVKDECHWGYFRIYTPQGTKLLRGAPPAIPAEATMLGQTIPARTDNLGSEDLPNAQVFGAMLLTPTQTTTETNFEFALPPEVVTPEAAGGLWVYRLKVQKQPGTLAQTLILNLRLPAGAEIKSATLPLQASADAWTAQVDLRQDLTLEISFRLK